MYTKLEDIIPTLIEEGYNTEDPWDIVEAFENKVAKYAGSKYAVATDSCTNSLFLCLKYLKAEGKISIPKKTYISVPQTIIHAGCDVEFVDKDIEELQNKIAQKLGYKLVDHKLELYGTKIKKN